MNDELNNYLDTLEEPCYNQDFYEADLREIDVDFEMEQEYDV